MIFIVLRLLEFPLGRRTGGRADRWMDGWMDAATEFGFYQGMVE